MRKLTSEKRGMVVRTLVEGNSVNSTARICGVSKLTVLRLLADLGTLCRDFHDLTVRGLHAQRIQVDEIWSFVGCKARTKMAGGVGHGDCWTWIAIDSDSKLVISYLVGGRDANYACDFMWDVADRVEDRIQLTSDGHTPYLQAVRGAFGDEIDYAMLQKVYGVNPEAERRYSPAICTGACKQIVSGNPDPAHVNTSHVERQNLTLRMQNRRHTRLTNGFSKKFSNHVHAIALHYFHYNFIRRHQTLKTTPAVKAGITDHEWTVEELVAMLEREERSLANGGRINRADRK